MQTVHKHPSMVVHSDDPLNTGAPLTTLRQKYITPQEYFFVRNHGKIPSIDPDTYVLTVTGLVEHPLQFSLAELKAMEFKTEAALLQCAGIRRAEMAEYRPIPGELPWGADPIGNATWQGVPLQVLLDMADVKVGAKHIALQGMDEVFRHGEQVGFGGSVPLEKAHDVLLAYAMDGGVLPPTHGFPLRAVVPGYIGARSVKWLSNINVQDAPSSNYFQAHAYKLFPPYISSQTVDWNNGDMLGELATNAVICQPEDKAVCQPGSTLVQGYAVSHHGGPIERVELSTDGGKTWADATLLEQQPWSWCFWEVTINLNPGHYELVVRASGTGHHSQPESVEPIWNFKGYMNNAWQRVHVHVQGD